MFCSAWFGNHSQLIDWSSILLCLLCQWKLTLLPCRSVWTSLWFSTSFWSLTRVVATLARDGTRPTNCFLAMIATKRWGLSCLLFLWHRADACWAFPKHQVRNTLLQRGTAIGEASDVTTPCFSLDARWLFSSTCTVAGGWASCSTVHSVWTSVSKSWTKSASLLFKLNALLNSSNSGQPELYDPDQFLVN